MSYLSPFKNWNFLFWFFIFCFISTLFEMLVKIWNTVIIAVLYHKQFFTEMSCLKRRCNVLASIREENIHVELCLKCWMQISLNSIYLLNYKIKETKETFISEVKIFSRETGKSKVDSYVTKSTFRDSLNRRTNYFVIFPQNCFIFKYWTKQVYFFIVLMDSIKWQPSQYRI